jgi:hypothetical protein
VNCRRHDGRVVPDFPFRSTSGDTVNSKGCSTTPSDLKVPHAGYCRSAKRGYRQNRIHAPHPTYAAEVARQFRGPVNDSPNRFGVASTGGRSGDRVRGANRKSSASSLADRRSSERENAAAHSGGATAIRADEKQLAIPKPEATYDGREDFDTWDRCIPRGLLPSMLPAEEIEFRTACKQARPADSGPIASRLPQRTGNPLVTEG